MPSPECFYLHLDGAQQGPYTIPQIDHLLHSGLIGVETLYWREGLDQWQPVTSLIPIRKKPHRWVGLAIAAGILAVIGVLFRIFGPVLIDGWQEADQHTYTESAAYWRARDVVRTSESKGAFIEFADFSEDLTSLEAPNKARVRLYGSMAIPHQPPVPMAWDVPMQFDKTSTEWSGGPPVRVASP